MVLLYNLLVHSLWVDTFYYLKNNWHLTFFMFCSRTSTVIILKDWVWWLSLELLLYFVIIKVFLLWHEWFWFCSLCPLVLLQTSFAFNTFLPVITKDRLCLSSWTWPHGIIFFPNLFGTNGLQCSCWHRDCNHRWNLRNQHSKEKYRPYVNFTQAWVLTPKSPSTNYHFS